MKRVFCVILTLITLANCFIFTACSNGQNNAPGNTSTFKITKDYVIIRPENANFTEITACKLLADSIKEATDIKLEIEDDTSKASSFEIVVGNADRDGVSHAKNNAGDQGYSFFVSNKKVYIYGTDERFLELAITSFISEYITNSTNIVLPNKLSTAYKNLFSRPNLTINGVDISNYTIVYAPEGTTTHYRTYDNAWVEVAKYEDAANAIAHEIYLLTGKELTVVCSNSTTETDYEILVGKVPGREEINEFYVTYGVGYSDEKYGFGVVGTKLLISGGSPNSAYYAAREFTKACAELDNSDFNSPLIQSKKDLVKVACIGDGITHGSSSTNVNEYSYPVYLQKMLGFRYYVSNYGTPNKQMTDYDAKIEVDEGATKKSDYDRSIEFVPDIVIIMLGTNDADPGNASWKNADYKELYLNAAARMIEKYRSVRSDVQIYLLTPPPQASSDEWSENIGTVAEWNRELAESHNCYLIDIYNQSIDLNWKFSDGLHPKNEQYADLAKVIYDGMKYTINI